MFPLVALIVVLCCVVLCLLFTTVLDHLFRESLVLLCSCGIDPQRHLWSTLYTCANCSLAVDRARATGTHYFCVAASQPPGARLAPAAQYTLLLHAYCYFEVA